MDQIIYEDKDLIVCHKKAGIPVQSARLGQKDMVSILNNYLAEKTAETKDGQKEPQQVFVVHRLDQPVEGVIVFAKNKKAAASLSRQITDGSMKKQYQAVVCVTQKGQKYVHEGAGCLGNILTEAERRAAIADSGCPFYEEKEYRENGSPSKETRTYHLVDYLAKDGRTNRSEVVPQDHKDAKRAELVFSVLNYGERAEDGSWYELTDGIAQLGRMNKQYARVAIDLKTGRHHQIRVQMAHAGLPLYGDQKYHPNWQDYVLDQEESENELFGFFGSVPPKKNPALALCSVRLTFVHPTTGKKMQFETKPTTEAFGESAILFPSYL